MYKVHIPESELRERVRGRSLERAVPGEGDGIAHHEVGEEQVPVGLSGQAAHRLLQPQLDRPHQLGRLELLVRHLAVTHAPVTELLLLVLR